MTASPSLDDFPARAFDKLRYGDTDRQGHVNNADFATFFETGRVEVLFDPAEPVLEAGESFVLARLEIDLVAEINWPGTVEIGSAVTRIGRSSFSISQALFQNGRLAARGVSVVVMTSEVTRRSMPLTPAVLARLTKFAVAESGAVA